MLKIENLRKTYSIHQNFKRPLMLQALRGVDLVLNSGQTLAIVGESGCGKTTLAKLLMGLETKTEGKIFWDDIDLSQLSSQKLSEIIQIVFQDPNSSLNPRKKIFDSIAEPLRVKSISEDDISKIVHDIASEVGLRLDWLDRYPHMLSGGQKQRVGIARALVTRPKVIICDEPVSALDVSVQAQVLNLLLELQEKHNMSYLFISHDLSVVQFIADQVAVLYLGEIVEYADKESIFNKPLHPYTQLLMESAPSLEKEASVNVGNAELPSPLKPPMGCGFQARCPMVENRCRIEKPILQKKNNQFVACHKVKL